MTKVKFSFDDGFVVSTGGNDKCVFVWQTDMAVADPAYMLESQPTINIEDIPQ